MIPSLPSKPLRPILLALLATLLPASLAAAAPRAQEAGTPEAQQAPERPDRKAFSRLTSPAKKALQAALRQIEKGDEEKGEAAEGVAAAIAVGDAAIPTLLTSVPRMEKAARLAYLWQALDPLLKDDDLYLAWESRRKQSPLALDQHLLRRWADSSRQDAEAFLTEQLAAATQAKDPERARLLAYEASRGLAFRGHADALDAIDAVIQADWLERAAELRADFAGINRAPLAAKAVSYLERRPRAEKLASLHLFELFGKAEQAKALLPFLGESDTSIRLAAIDACRVVIDGAPPLEKPSMVEIIQRAEAWKARL